MVPPINFYRTRIKDQVIITNIMSSSNLIIFLFVLPAHVDVTHLVLSLLAVVPARLKSNADYQCSMSSAIHLK